MASPFAPLRACRPVLAALLLLTYLPACTAWRVGTPTPAGFVEREQPGRVRVTRTDGSQLILLAPVVRNDSLSGRRETVTAGGNPATEAVSLPLSDVQSVATRKFSAGRTVLLVGGVVGVFLVIWVIDCAGRSGWDAIGCP